MLDTLTALVEAGAAAPWVLPVVLLVAVFDALVPPVPSEGIVVALAAVAVAGDGPDLLLLAVAAGVGAFLGDSLTYVVGRRFGPQRLHRIRREEPEVHISGPRQPCSLQTGAWSRPHFGHFQPKRRWPTVSCKIGC